MWIKSLRKKRKFCIYNNKKSKKSRPLIRIRIRTKVVRITAQPLDHYTLRCGVKMERLFNQIFCNTVMTANIFHIGFNIRLFFSYSYGVCPKISGLKWRKNKRVFSRQIFLILSFLHFVLETFFNEISLLPRLFCAVMTCWSHWLENGSCLLRPIFYQFNRDSFMNCMIVTKLNVTIKIKGTVWAEAR